MDSINDMNQTIDYYNKNSEKFFKNTVNCLYFFGMFF